MNWKWFLAFPALYLVGFLVVGLYGCWEAGHVISGTAWVGCFFGWWIIAGAKLIGAYRHMTGWWK